MSVENFFHALESRRTPRHHSVRWNTHDHRRGEPPRCLQIDTSGTISSRRSVKPAKKSPSASVTRVSINTLAGNDFVSLGRITQPATILGGDGNDTLTGGEGADSIDGQNGNGLYRWSWWQ